MYIDQRRPLKEVRGFKSETPENVTNTSGLVDTGTSYDADGANEPMEEDEESGMEGFGIEVVDGVSLGGEN